MYANVVQTEVNILESKLAELNEIGLCMCVCLQRLWCSVRLKLAFGNDKPMQQSVNDGN